MSRRPEAFPEPPVLRTDQIRELEELLSWLEWYLLPRPLGGAGHRAHQFTINGLTYPFVRHSNFAAVPDPPDRRRYDMYAGLHLASPGDLLYFFQADPQAPGGDINSRRGIRGVYRVLGPPRRAASVQQERTSGFGYRILHRCPSCETQHGTFAKKCPLCGEFYPEVTLGRKSVASRVLSAQLPIEPLIAFERSVSDERVYADFSDPGLVWVGRHDNAMGAGKGSSIRQLLPEEAVKLVRLLAREPGQSVGAKSISPPPTGPELAHADGVPISQLPTSSTGTVAMEDELYHLIVKQLFTEHSGLRQALQPHLPAGLSWEHVEYASSTFPWGYTAGAADFVIFFRDDAGRRFLVIIECKRGTAHDEAVLQAMLYVERVLQVAFLSATPNAVPDETCAVQILPVIVAENLKRPRQPDPKVAIPQPYAFERTYFGGTAVRAQVASPVFLRYVAPGADAGLPSEYRPLRGYTFEQVRAESTIPIIWEPEPGSVGTAAEMKHILSTSWAAARAATSSGTMTLPGI